MFSITHTFFICVCNKKNLVGPTRPRRVFRSFPDRRVGQLGNLGNAVQFAYALFVSCSAPGPLRRGILRFDPRILLSHTGIQPDPFYLYASSEIRCF